VSFLYPFSAQNNADNTDNWKGTKLPSFPELVDFSVTCWFLTLYRKSGILFPDDFKSLASPNSATPAAEMIITQAKAKHQ